MKVHITSTPEIKTEDIKAVVNLLSEVKGELVFIEGEPLTVRQMRFNHRGYEIEDFNELLSFDDFFHLCEYYAVNNEIPENEFVVLLTSIDNDQNWFSAFDKKYIFVNTIGWEYLTEKDSKYGIAYQIVENIFESLINIDINNVDTEPNIHQPSIGCITDMCINKKEVILKLRTGYICESCLNRATENGVNERILLQIQLLVENIRLGLMNFDYIKSKIEPDLLTIEDDGSVSIGSTNIAFEYVPHSLYILFLKHLDGLKTEELKKKYEELKEIYETIRNTKGYEDPIKNVCGTGYSKKGTFLKVKSEINKAIINQTNKLLSEYYVINNDNRTYKVKLSKDYIKDRFKK